VKLIEIKGKDRIAAITRVPASEDDDPTDENVVTEVAPEEGLEATESTGEAVATNDTSQENEAQNEGESNKNE
jgi:hypothetical protein